jgi:hypothetical protein
VFLERPAKVVDVVEACSGRNLRYGERTVAQQIISFAESSHRDVFGHGMAAKLLEQPAEMEAAQACHIREHIDRQLLLIALLDMLEDGRKALDIFHPFCIFVLGKHRRNMAAKKQRKQPVKLGLNSKLDNRTRAAPVL